MAEQDEIARLKEGLTQQQAASMTLLGIVEQADRKLDELTGAVRSVQAHEAIVDARLNTVDARINAMQRDIEASFRQIDASMATKQDLAYLATKVDTLAEEMHSKLDQVIELLTKRGE